MLNPEEPEISRLVGHAGTHVTELVYRHQLRPVIESGAVAMERLFAVEHQAGDAAEGGGEGA
ncbi:MAG: hypothetical protein WB441_06085 [Nocardioidaceae bacterium]